MKLGPKWDISLGRTEHLRTPILWTRFFRDGHEPGGAVVAVARVVAALVVVAAFAHWFTQPVERSLGDLLRGLDAGEVTWVVLGPATEKGMVGSFAQRVEWETPGRDGYATYEVNTVPGEQLDDDMVIVQAVADSPGAVALERRAEYYIGPSGIQWSPFAIVHLMMLFVLIGGPQPRWATMWAWFWLSFLPLGWAVFLLLEPVPVWHRSMSHPPERRFTGGWAWITAVMAQTVSAQIIDGWYDSVPWN